MFSDKSWRGSAFTLAVWFSYSSKHAQKVDNQLGKGRIIVKKMKLNNVDHCFSIKMPCSHNEKPEKVVVCNYLRVFSLLHVGID